MLTLRSVNSHRYKKKFGQNFLHNKKIINRIIRIINLDKNDHIIEIGPGLGILTQPLLYIVKKLDAIELDYDLIPQLQKKFYGYENFHLHQGDILKFNLNNLIGNNKLRIIGNLPYNISTPIIFKLLQYNNYIKDMHFMLQKEVALRLAASPGNKTYGRLSIMTQYSYQVSLLFNVAAKEFKPVPAVDSTFVKLTPIYQRPVSTLDLTLFKEIITKVFNHRRKTIKNTLKEYLTDHDFTKLNLDTKLRPEEISVWDFVNIINYIKGKQ